MALAAALSEAKEALTSDGLLMMVSTTISGAATRALGVMAAALDALAADGTTKPALFATRATRTIARIGIVSGKCDEGFFSIPR
jgi:hypothetical protein